jgi:hypothetical protein
MKGGYSGETDLGFTWESSRMDPGIHKGYQMILRRINTARVKRIYGVLTEDTPTYSYITDSGRYEVNTVSFVCTCPSRLYPCKHLEDALVLYFEGK